MIRLSPDAGIESKSKMWRRVIDPREQKKRPPAEPTGALTIR